MKILLYIFRLTFVVSGFVISSCDKDLDTGGDLSKQDKEYIKGLGILDDEERIILFDSQGGGFNGRKTSGNFFTDKRIASYWIDKRDTTKSILTMHFTRTLTQYGDIRNLMH
jgi:hypothetical protein